MGWVHLIKLLVLIFKWMFGEKNKNPANARSQRVRAAQHRRVMNELNQATDQIYAYLSRPENAALRQSLLDGSQEFGNPTTGQALINRMGLSIGYGPNFYDAMNHALGRIRRDEQNRPTSQAITPAPRFDVVLTDAGDSPIRIVAMVRDVTKQDVRTVRDVVNHVPSTLLTNVEQVRAELVQETFQAAGATVELVTPGEAAAQDIPQAVEQNAEPVAAAPVAPQETPPDVEPVPTPPVALQAVEQKAEPVAAPVDAPPAIPESARVDVVLTDAGITSLKVMARVREIAGISREEARAIVDNVPSSILSGVDHREAERVRAILEEVGATVEVVAAGS